MNKSNNAIELIKASGLFDESWYLANYPDVAASGRDPLEHYLQLGVRFQRNPGPKFDVRFYLESNPDVAENGMNPLVHYILHGKKEGRLPRAFSCSSGGSESYQDVVPTRGNNFQIKTTDMHGTEVTLSPAPCFGTKEYEINVQLSGPCVVLPYEPKCKNNDLKWPSIGIHLHLYYINMIDEFSYFLMNISGGFDLYVSVVDSKAVPLVLDHFSRKIPNAKVNVKCFENRGRDIAPFVAGFSHELCQHDFICHIHSKKSPHNWNKSDWRRQLLVNLMGSTGIVQGILNLFQCNPHLGMIFPEYHHSLKGQISWGTNYNVCQGLAAKLGVEIDQDRLVLFPAGSMFWARGAAIAPLLDADLAYSDFPLEESQVDGTLAHAVERLLGEVVVNSGYDLLQVKSSKPHDLLFYFPSKWPYKPGLSKDALALLVKTFNEERVGRRAKKVVYTALSGGYEVPLAHETLDPDFDYVLFSDCPITDCGFWEVRPMDYWHPEPVRMSRYVKTHPHKYFPEYDVAIWVDANVLIRGNLGNYLDFIDSDHTIPLGGIPHPQRNCIYDEAHILIDTKKDISSRVERQLEIYKKEAYPKKNGLIETNFLVIDLNSPNTDKVLNEWWTMIDKFSHRDQLSLNYALWKNKADWHPLMDEKLSLRSNFDFAYFGHGINSGYPKDYCFFGSKVVDPYLYENAKFSNEHVDSLGVDIVVCVHNALDDVKLCLSSVLPSMRQVDRLVIVDDASNSETGNYLDEIAKGNSQVEIRRNPDEAKGYCVSANVGMFSASADFVLLLNSDTLLCRSALVKMLKVAVSSPGVGIVGPLSNAASSQSIPRIKGGVDQTAINALPQGLSVVDMDKLCEDWSHPTLFPSVPLVHGFCQLINRKVIDVIGGFDEESFPFGYGEENDYCFRVVNAGFDLKVATNAFVYHKKSASYTDSGRRGQLMKQGAVKLKEKHTEDRLTRAIRIMEGHPLLEGVRVKAGKFFHQED